MKSLPSSKATPPFRRPHVYWTGENSFSVLSVNEEDNVVLAYTREAVPLAGRKN